MRHPVTVLCSSLLALALAAPAVAQDDTPDRFSGIFQLDTTNAYFFRGILQEREGILFQPWAELYYSVYSSESGLLRDVSLGGGMWNSFHSERTLASYDSPQRDRDGGDQNQWWYEADYYPLVSLGFAGGVNLLTVYYFYTSPNDAFTTAQELNFKLSWDDSEVSPFPVKPWVNLAIETENTAFGSDEGVGLQAGVAPTLYATESGSFSLAAPVEVGLSLDDYYERARGGENAFGYATAGLSASIPLSFIPESAGSWSVGLTGKYYFFNNTLENVNRGRSTYPLGMVSLGVTF
jgi:hypothetical protein